MRDQHGDLCGAVGALPARKDDATGARQRHIVDILIDERAKRLSRVPFLWPALRGVLDPLLDYPAAVSWANRLAPLPAEDVLGILHRFLSLSVAAHGLEHVPRRGRAIIVANHPTGMVDGMAVYSAMRSVRSDLTFFANRDAVRLVPDLARIIIPVEWLAERRTSKRMRDTLRAVRRAFIDERAVIIFPAGGIATLNWRGLKDLDWLPATAKLIQKHRVPAIPLHIQGRNSWLFYLFSLIHEELRDLARFHEILRKRGKTFQLRFGPPLQGAELDAPPAVLIDRLQTYVERGLSGRRPLPRDLVLARAPQG